MAIGEQERRFLRQLKQCRNASRRSRLLVEGGPKLQRALREIAFNLLKGNVTLSKAQLSRLRQHKKGVRALARKNTPLRTRLKVEQRGGFLSALIAPVLTSLASSVISRLSR